MSAALDIDACNPKSVPPAQPAPRTDIALPAICRCTAHSASTQVTPIPRHLNMSYRLPLATMLYPPRSVFLWCHTKPAKPQYSTDTSDFHASSASEGRTITPTMTLREVQKPHCHLPSLHPVRVRHGQDGTSASSSAATAPTVRTWKSTLSVYVRPRDPSSPPFLTSIKSRPSAPRSWPSELPPKTIRTSRVRHLSSTTLRRATSYVTEEHRTGRG